MKFDRIAVKITFFIFISGLVLISNVAISQTPVPNVTSWTQSAAYSASGTYGEIEVNDAGNVTFRVTLGGTDLDLVQLQFKVTGNLYPGTKTVSPTLNPDNTQVVYEVTAREEYTVRYQYALFDPDGTGICPDGTETDEYGRCWADDGVYVAGPGKYNLSATLVTSATNGATVTVGSGVSTSASWNFWIVDTVPSNPPDQQQPPLINPPQQQPSQQQPPQQQPDNTQQSGDPQQSDDTQQSGDPQQQPPQQPDNTQQSDDPQQSDDTQQNVNVNNGGGGVHRTQPVKPAEPVNHTVKPFDYEAEGVGRIVISEWMMSGLNNAPQWIELYNTTNNRIILRNWKIVGRFIDGDDNIHILPEKTIPVLRLGPKQASLVVSFGAQSVNHYSSNLRGKIYSLRASNAWRGSAIVLELQDGNGNPVDRIGSLTEDDKIKWFLPFHTRNSVNKERRISLIRRLKSQKSREYNFKLGMSKHGWFAADKVEKLTEMERSEYFYGYPTDLGTPGYRTEDTDPLPVTLSSFVPQVAESGQVVLNWTTASELENAGFNIFRSEAKEGTFVKVNASLIQGAGTTSDRNAYTWIDTTAKPNREYYYRIEDMSFDGISEALTTQRLKGVFTAKNRSLTPWGLLKK